jgi:hypothetical protein
LLLSFTTRARIGEEGNMTLFKILFWGHQIVFGLPSIVIGLFLWLTIWDILGLQWINLRAASTEEIVGMISFMIVWMAAR